MHHPAALHLGCWLLQALLLRLNMPESAEFEAARKALECGVDPKDITPAGMQGVTATAALGGWAL